MKARHRPAIAGTELAPGYLVLAHLNRGNRLDVYDAWSVERESRCVLKTLRPDRAHEARPARALLQEGRLLRRFTHPHLVRAYEVTEAADDGRPVLVLETLAGETLSHLIGRLEDRGRRLPLAEVAMLGLQLGSVLGYLHRKGWLHLDLKPSNIVAEAGRAKLIDLSIARRPGRARAGTGTFEYMSPEQAAGGRLTEAADVWGLAAVLHTSLVGEPPYGWPEVTTDGSFDETTATTTDETSSASSRSTGWSDDGSGGGRFTRRDQETYPQLEADPAPIRERRRLPVELARLVDACLARDPAQRPTLDEVSDELDAWLAATTGEPDRPSARLPP